MGRKDERPKEGSYAPSNFLIMIIIILGNTFTKPTDLINKKLEGEALTDIRNKVFYPTNYTFQVLSGGSRSQKGFDLFNKTGISKNSVSLRTISGHYTGHR